MAPTDAQGTCRRALYRIGRAAAACCLAALLAALAQAAPSKEYRIKAAYLYNVSKFIHWPEQRELQDRIHVCVLGHNPFDDYLSKLEQQQAKGRAIAVHYLPGEPDVDELTKCHLAFIAKQNENAVRRYLDMLANQPVLTVGEGEKFLHAGGLISLIKADNSIQLDINLTGAKAQGFAISANLLEVAREVR